MPCKTMLLGDFDAKINRIYMCSKQFAFFLVSKSDTKINTKQTGSYTLLVKIPIVNHAKTV
jgi:hypothetical protein